LGTQNLSRPALLRSKRTAISAAEIDRILSAGGRLRQHYKNPNEGGYKFGSK